MTTEFCADAPHCFTKAFDANVIKLQTAQKKERKKDVTASDSFMPVNYEFMWRKSERILDFSNCEGLLKINQHHSNVPDGSHAGFLILPDM